MTVSKLQVYLKLIKLTISCDLVYRVTMSIPIPLIMHNTNSTDNLDRWFRTDRQLQYIYPPSVRTLSRKHWTPLGIAEKAAAFLYSKNGAKILDIGSGVGKFCLAAAYFQPRGFYYGVEQRKDLFDHAETARRVLGLKNVHFIHRNFTMIDFSGFDHFYFFNSFQENLEGEDRIDESLDHSLQLYSYYTHFLSAKLDNMARGTRVVTYHSLGNEIPLGYKLVESLADNQLNFWIKS
jgi:SAM-dependent methyltransferase